MKQSSLEDPFDNNGEDEISRELDTLGGSDDELPPTPPRPPTPVPCRGLPWTPKVRSVMSKVKYHILQIPHTHI